MVHASVGAVLLSVHWGVWGHSISCGLAAAETLYTPPPMEPISQFFVISPRGDTIIARDCTVLLAFVIRFFSFYFLPNSFYFLVFHFSFVLLC
jgi:hypothetical protein